MAHGTPLAPSEADDSCGVAGAFLLDVGISSSYHIAKFFRLTGPQARRNSADRDLASVVPSYLGAAGSGRAFRRRSRRLPRARCRSTWGRSSDRRCEGRRADEDSSLMEPASGGLRCAMRIVQPEDCDPIHDRHDHPRGAHDAAAHALARVRRGCRGTRSARAQRPGAGGGDRRRHRRHGLSVRVPAGPAHHRRLPRRGDHPARDRQGRDRRRGDLAATCGAPP